MRTAILCLLLALLGASADKTIVLAGSSGVIVDTQNNVYTLTQNGQVAINGVVDITTSGVTMLAYVNSQVWLQSAKLWHQKIPLSIGVSWTAITGASSYNLYQSINGTMVKIQTGNTGISTDVTQGLTAGATTCFAITAVLNGVESPLSPPSCSVVVSWSIPYAKGPIPVPKAPTQFTVT